MKYVLLDVYNIICFVFVVFKFVFSRRRLLYIICNADVKFDFFCKRHYRQLGNFANDFPIELFHNNTYIKCHHGLTTVRLGLWLVSNDSNCSKCFKRYITIWHRYNDGIHLLSIYTLCAIRFKVNYRRIIYFLQRLYHNRDAHH